MMIDIEKRFIFAANSKAASTSIEHVLTPYSKFKRRGTPQEKHIGLFEAFHKDPYLSKLTPEDRSDYFIFGVMREPLEWILSWYRYRKGNKVSNPLPTDMSFADFWMAKDWNILRNNGSKYLQKDIFCGPAGKVLADVIVPHHCLTEMMGDIFAKLGIEGDLPKKNMSRISSEVDIPDHIREEMIVFYEDDYVLWNHLDQINETGLGKLDQRRGTINS